ncbi:hypothetical protein T01_7683 [Trichinella spiralis]|uniref:Uncharacterized protein n=1 Tax=Trichinella spiralis TaxID=6334 RepID=A0A0V0Z919_TRISP|nr:hypothetical protein T01_7683 [Trichinella spiralis]
MYQCLLRSPYCWYLLEQDCTFCHFVNGQSR